LCWLRHCWGGDVKSTQIAASVVSGIGFLAGGLIFKGRSSVSGLNTAATRQCTRPSASSDSKLEKIVRRVGIEPGVFGVSWKIVPTTNDGRRTRAGSGRVSRTSRARTRYCGQA